MPPGGASLNSQGHSVSTTPTLSVFFLGPPGRARKVSSVLLASVFPGGGQPQPPSLSRHKWEGRPGDPPGECVFSGWPSWPPQPQSLCLLLLCPVLHSWNHCSAPSGAALTPDPNPGLCPEQASWWDSLPFSLVCPAPWRAAGRLRWNPSQTPVLQAGWGKDSSDRIWPWAHNLVPQVPPNIGPLFRAITEGDSVALGLNKNPFSKALLLPCKFKNLTRILAGFMGRSKLRRQA